MLYPPPIVERRLQIFREHFKNLFINGDITELQYHELLKHIEWPQMTETGRIFTPQLLFTPFRTILAKLRANIAVEHIVETL